MRKIWIVLCGLLILTLSACDAFRNYDEELLSLEDTILNQIPEKINADFSLDLPNEYQVSFRFQSLEYKDMFKYAPPFYDVPATLDVTIKRGTSQKTFSKQVILLSLDSGYHETKIYLTLPHAKESIQRDVYTQVEVTVETQKNGVMTIEHHTQEAQLRGRGNSTWYVYEKKPYRLRFDKNTSILGMPAAKNYVLLAEYADKSLIRNAVTQKMASLFDTLDPLEVRPVELYINFEYVGVYLLTEHIENHPNKLALDTKAGVLDTNYLFELDMRFYEQNIEEGLDWFIVDRHPYQIKDPDPDDPLFIEGHADYLREKLYALESALMAKEGYEHLLDVDVAVDFFLIHEIAKNVDVGWSSVFMIKKEGGPFTYGPLWDFDFAYGNADYIDYGIENWYGMRAWKNRMFILMMQVPEIREKFKERFTYFETHVLPEIEMVINAYSRSMADMGNRNVERWPTLNTYVWPNPFEVMERKTHKLQVDYVLLYLIGRTLWMKEELKTERYHMGMFE